MFGFVKQNDKVDHQQPDVCRDHETSAHETYENILKLPSTSITLAESSETNIRKRTKRQRKIPFEEKAFFMAATNNESTTLAQMNINTSNVNQTDAYGWSALMMAAYEGHLDIVKYLIQQGAHKDYADKHGNTAELLAKKQNHTNVIRYLRLLHRSEEEVICLSSDDERVANTKDSIKSTHCDTCELEFKESEKVTHRTSTLHRFNDKPSQKPIKGFVIPESNVGYQMLVKQGWSGEDGLGCEKDGILFPVKTTIRKPRSGLGIKQPTKARVTHFHAFDQAAIQTSSAAISKANSLTNNAMKTKRRIKIEKQQSQRRDRHLRSLLS